MLLGLGLSLVPAIAGRAWVRASLPRPIELNRGEAVALGSHPVEVELDALPERAPRTPAQGSELGPTETAEAVEGSSEGGMTLLTLVVVDDAGVPVQGLWARPWSVREESGSLIWHRTALDALSGTLEIRGLRSGRHSIDLGGIGVVTKTWELRVEEQTDVPVFVELQRGWPVHVDFLDGFGSNLEDLSLRVFDVHGVAVPFTWTPAPGARRGDDCTEGWSDGGMPHAICEGRGVVAGLPAGRYSLEYQTSGGTLGSWVFDVLRDRPSSITVDA